MTIIPPDDYERDLPATAESLLDVLERMAKKEFLRNNRQLNVSFNWPVGCRVLRVICFMNHLEKLDFSECDLALQHLKHLFRSCPKLIKLHFKPFKKSGINEFIRLKSDFQRLRYLELTCCNHSSWRVVQEILTWVKLSEFKRNKIKPLNIQLPQGMCWTDCVESYW